MKITILLGCMVGPLALAAEAEDNDALRARYEKESVCFAEVVSQAEEDRLSGKPPEESASLEQVVAGLSLRNWFIRLRAKELVPSYVRSGWLTVEQFNRVAKAAEEERSHDRLSGDAHLTPIVDGLASESKAIRARAVELMIPYVRDGWIALEQFERLTWEKLDAHGRGLMLWCAASRRTRAEEPLGLPLSVGVTVRLWRQASAEPVPLPYLAETAQKWLSLRGSDWDPIRLGEHLASVERQRLACQFLSVFGACTAARERLGVIWMILDLQATATDSTLTDWYAREADPALRARLLDALYDAIRAPRPDDDAQERRVTEAAYEAIKARGSAILALAELAGRDWYPPASTAAARVREALSVLQKRPPPRPIEEKKPAAPRVPGAGMF